MFFFVITFKTCILFHVSVFNYVCKSNYIMNIEQNRIFSAVKLIPEGICEYVAVISSINLFRFPISSHTHTHTHLCFCFVSISFQTKLFCFLFRCFHFDFFISVLFFIRNRKLCKITVNKTA